MNRGARRAVPILTVVLAVLTTAGLRCAPETPAPRREPPAAASVERLLVRILAEWPHDPGAFTQGLVFADGGLWESVGLYGRSEVRRVELESGRVLRAVKTADGIFAEGLALVPGRLVQLSWKEQRAMFYDPASLERRGEAVYEGEGWGLAYDGSKLWMSDGSASLQVRDPRSFALERRLSITKAGQPQGFLNELEWADGALWANVWQSDAIVRIDPASGRVTAEVDASGLLSAQERARTDVLNGIAWDPARRVFYITGKLWPKLFEVEFARR
jgi:glutaminyl-peptide cyclotransferase